MIDKIDYINGANSFYIYVYLMCLTQLKLQSRTALLMTSITLFRVKETRQANAIVRVGIGLLKRRITSRR